MPKTERLLKGSIIKSILMISLPVIGANVLHTVYQVIDTFWVGRLGTEAVAAVSLAFPVIMFLTSLAMGLTMGGSILVAQYNGKKRRDQVLFATGQTFALVVSIAIAVAALGYFISGYLINLLTSDPAVVSQAITYLQISFLAMPFVFIFMIFQSVLRGVGEVKFPLYIVLTTVIINFFIDPLFMFGFGPIPALGVAGVAWATFITEGLAALVSLIVILFGGFGLHLRLKDLKPNLIWVKKLLVLGVPGSVEMSSRSFSMLLMTFLISSLGTLPLAAYGVGTKLLSLAIIPGVGFLVTTTTLVGNNLGAGQLKRAEAISKTSIRIAFWSLLLLGVFIFIFAPQIAEFFVPGETDLINMSAEFTRIIAPIFGIIGVHMIIIGTIKAAGQTVLTMFLTSFVSFGIFIIAYFLANVFELKELGVWISYPIINILGLFLLLYFYYKKEWLHKKLV